MEGLAACRGLRTTGCAQRNAKGEAAQAARQAALWGLQKIRVGGGFAVSQHDAHVVQAVFVYGNDGEGLAAAGAAHHARFRRAGLGDVFAAAGALVEKKDFHAVRGYGFYGASGFSQGYALLSGRGLSWRGMWADPKGPAG